MKPRLLAILALIVILPLALLTWLGLRVAHHERTLVELRVGEILAGRLLDVDARIQEVLSAQGRALLRLQGLSNRPTDELRALSAALPTVSQLFVLDATGAPVFPPPGGPLTDDERDFLARTRDIWLDRIIPPGPGDAAPAAGTARNRGNAPDGSDHGWYAWFWGNGIRLIFWWRDGNGAVAGAELNRSRLLSDIIARLPDTDPHDPYGPVDRIALRDSQGAILYQWGMYSPAENEKPRAALDLSPPLGSWRLEHYAPAEALTAGAGRSALFNVLAGVAALAVSVVGLTAYFYRENAREMREAAQRISFVNQVSHELKTPLTNIRLYAEMLEEDLDPDDTDTRRRLNVIVSESQRLSRLIANVLTFSRHRRSALRLRPAPGIVDDVLRRVVDHFTAPLQAKGLAVEFDPGAPDEVVFDRDAVEQVVGNLLSNVEKYASTGTRVRIASVQDGAAVRISVSDDGPGVSARERRRIFEPFYRVSSRLTDGVAGTGIGLAIARDLARLHGGDVVLADATEGASFVFTLHAPPTAPEEEP